VDKVFGRLKSDLGNIRGLSDFIDSFAELHGNGKATNTYQKIGLGMMQPAARRNLMKLEA
jgi:hypothetical protein